MKTQRRPELRFYSGMAVETCMYSRTKIFLLRLLVQNVDE